MRRFVVLASLVLSAPAVAQEPPTSPAKPLYRFPGLPDLPVAGPAQRAQGPRGQLFISPAGEPFRAEPGEPYPSITWFTQADSDHDGKIDRTEFADDFARFFAVLDINHDSIIDSSEVVRYEREVVPEVANGDDFGGGFIGAPSPGRGRGPRGGPRLGIKAAGAGQDDSGIQAPPPRRPDDLPIIGAGRYGMINIPQPISSMDINLDGNITPYEMRQAAIRRFTLLDNGNRAALRFADLPQPPAQRSGEGNRRRRDRGRDGPTQR